jgi:AcrR family transcriptional regulator
MPRPAATVVEPGGYSIRDRVLDAAEVCLERYGLQKTTVEDIARAAEVSRATIYRNVAGGRDEIVVEVLLRVARRELRRIGAAIEHIASPAERLVEGIVRSRHVAQTDERLALLFSPEIIGHAGSIPEAADAVVAALVEFLEPLLEQARAQDEADTALTATELAEYVNHLMVSLLTFASSSVKSDDALRRMLQRFLVAGLRAEA